MKSPLCRLVICRRALKKWSEARDFMPWVMFREEYIYTFAEEMCSATAFPVYVLHEDLLPVAGTSSGI
ncbi:hypothetical protein MR642_04245 [bacterium]|nr:hypothetical protein [bacterium]